MEIIHKGQRIIYTIEFEKRKKTVLTIDPSGFVKVKAPKGADENLLKKAVEDKAQWILEQLEKVQLRSGVFEQPRPKRFMEGESFLYLGQAYPIEIAEDVSLEKSSVGFDGKVLLITVKTLNEGAVKDALLKFYNRECRKLILKRIAFYQGQFKVKPSSIEVKDMPSKWGLCSSERKLVFNWKLVMAPLEVVDYVVVHEMCHLVHMNHDRSFWRLVGKLLPDYESRTAWLTNNGAEMSF